MITLTQMPTAQQVTNLYLYGGLEALGDKVDAGLIRGNTSTPLNVDVNAYMSGPGRFASPSKFELVEKFMSPWLHPESLNLAPGTYTKEQLFSALGISVGYVTIDQSMYDDSKDDFLSRAYIWNTTAFKIHSGARFVVEANGKRHIENFAIVPHSNDNDRENFDFEAGTGFGGLANSLLQPKVDPSNIGRKVFFTFTGDVATTQFSFEDYVGASNTPTRADPPKWSSSPAWVRTTNSGSPTGTSSSTPMPMSGCTT
ncbi:MAG: hypothetical protein Q8M77_04505 [Hydrogenophaga sp.]|nr:hypothetical protein [Hydrogenophaga sp.]